MTAKETVGTGTKDVTYDVLDQSNQSKYTVTVGTVSENGKDTVLPELDADMYAFKDYHALFIGEVIEAYNLR